MKHCDDNKDAKNRKQKALAAIPALIAGLSIFIAITTFGYCILFLTSLYSITYDMTNYEKASRKNKSIIEEEQLTIKTTAVPTIPDDPKNFQSTATAKKVKPNAKENNKTTNELDETEKDQYNGNSYDIDELKRREIQQLREALPGNMLVPGHKTEEERNAIYAAIEEQRKIQNLIQNNRAAPSDKQRYYDLQAKRFEDEIELVNHCKEMLSNINDNEHIFHDLCAEITEHADMVLEANEKSLNSLRNQLL